MIKRDFNPIAPSALDERIRVVVVAPHPIQRTRLIHMILTHRDLDLVGVTPNSPEMMRICPHVRPDVVVIEPWGADLDAKGLVQLIQDRWPWVQVLVLSQVVEVGGALSGERVQGIGLLTDGTRSLTVGATIRALAAQGTVVPRWQSSGPPLRAFPDRALSRREWEVWRALGMGLSDAQIGERLAVNELTARLYVRNVLDHLGLSSRQDVVKETQADRPLPRIARMATAIPQRSGVAVGS